MLQPSLLFKSPSITARSADKICRLAAMYRGVEDRDTDRAHIHRCGELGRAINSFHKLKDVDSKHMGCASTTNDALPDAKVESAPQEQKRTN